MDVEFIIRLSGTASAPPQLFAPDAEHPLIVE
jgi:hypothetical protein